ncbi:MAG: hypothetical protein FJ385_03390, partial [Verrucomicrobia bacterium]|nr:hypothetical protein [Verrucomicrobiota bacterium]
MHPRTIPETAAAIRPHRQRARWILRRTSLWTIVSLLAQPLTGQQVAPISIPKADEFQAEGEPAAAPLAPVPTDAPLAPPDGITPAADPIPIANAAEA